MDRLLNKTVLITGANSGIGKAIVEELVTKGMKVVGMACELEKLKPVMEELKGKPGKLYPLQCDLNVQNEIERAVEWIEKNLGGVDILINNAGINMNSSYINGGMEELKKTLDINVLGTTSITKEILKLMKKKGIDNGCILNVNDACCFKVLSACNQNMSMAYISSKFALTALIELLRLELAQNESNIKVMNICPGLVETDMTLQWLKDNPRMALKPKDVAEAVLFMLQTPENVLIKDLVIMPIRELA